MIGIDAPQRIKWLAMINGDAEISVSGLKVAVVLAKRQNHETGQLNPAVSTIAKESNLTDRAVRKGIRQLCDRGYISVMNNPSGHLGGNHYNTNSYTLRVPRRVNSDSGVGVNDRSGVGVNGGSDTPEPPFRSPLNGCSPKQGIEQGIEQGNAQKRKRGDEHALFEQWYKHYPLKKGRGKAVNAFNKLDPDEGLLTRMIEALKAQEAEKGRKTENGEWVPEWPYPATWLNGQRWMDEVEILTASSHDNVSRLAVGDYT